MALLTGAWLALALVACDDGRTSSAPDAGPESDAGDEPRRICTITHPYSAPEKLYLLLVVDDSPAMSGVLPLLERELPRLLRVLGSGDVDDCEARKDCSEAERAQEFPGYLSVEVALVPASSTAGASGITGCHEANEEPVFAVPEPSAEECMGVHAGSFSTFLSYSSRLDHSAEDLAKCLVRTAEATCPVRQPLAAAAQALQATWGWGPNPGEVISVVVLSNGDDCSLDGKSSASWLTTAEGGTPSESEALLACAAHEDELATPESLRLRLDPEFSFESNGEILEAKVNRVTFHAIVGVPEKLESAAASRILADPAMRVRRSDDASASPGPEPSCELELPSAPGGSVSATPPRRLVQFADLFGLRGSVRSLCSAGGKGGSSAMLWDVLEEAFLPSSMRL